MSRIRLLHFIVQPVLVLDGEELTPGPCIAPQPLTMAALRELVEHWPEKMAEIEARATAYQSHQSECVQGPQSG